MGSEMCIRDSDNATATDNCGQVTVTFTDREAPGDCPQERIITRTFTAVDECGNEDTATQTITIQDTQAPVFTNVPDNITLECDQTLPTDNATATDNCGQVTVTFTDREAPGDCPQERVITRTFTAVDECGNEDTACLLYTSPSPRDLSTSRMPSSA